VKIELKNKSWFSSDFHLGHTNIAGKKVSKWNGGYRDFDSVSQMDETIINTINRYVGVEDTLFFLGDFTFARKEAVANYRDRIYCQTIHFVKGNHDPHVDMYAEKFTSVGTELLFEYEPNKRLYLHHFSHRVWHSSHRGTIHLYGHSHGTIPDHGKSMDVGVDVAYRMFGEYRPFSLEEIIDIMAKKEIPNLDHHRAKLVRG